MNEKVRLSLKIKGKEFLININESFKGFRVDGRSLSKGGTGLGLSIVKNLASTLSCQVGVDDVVQMELVLVDLPNQAKFSLKYL